MEKFGPGTYFEGNRLDDLNLVFVVYEGGRREPLWHDVLHSPDGFEWGYAGSGPADLARSMCHHLMGATPAPYIYQYVKADLIAPISTDEWRLPITRVLDSIARAKEQSRSVQ
jgi:hypothetical protein